MPDHKLNLGCGFRKYEGYINVDSEPQCRPDFVWDLEQTPWPWEDNSISEIKLEHVLEHLGLTPQAYLNIWKELYRVCRDGAVIDILVPYWRHDYFFDDPTHVRPITPRGILMFDQSVNLEHLKAGDRSTKLGLLTGVDISLRNEDIIFGYDTDEPEGSTVVEVSLRPRVVKPARGADWIQDHA